MNPAQSVPLIVARGLAAPWPGVPHSAFASTRATMISATTQKSAGLAGAAGGLWLAEPMNQSMGTERTTLVREARPPRAPAGAAARFAGFAGAASLGVSVTDFFFWPEEDHTFVP